MSNLLRFIINIIYTIIYTIIHLTISVFELIKYFIVNPMVEQAPYTPSKDVPASDSASDPASDPAAMIPPQHIQSLLQMHNIERHKIGANQLKLSTALCEAAQNHAIWMDANNKMSHTGSNRSSVATRVTQAGYRSMMVGENIAHGYSSPQAVMSGWLRSRGHRANILRKGYKEIGIGISGKYWCVVFATPIIMTRRLKLLGYGKFRAHEFIPDPISNK